MTNEQIVRNENTCQPSQQTSVKAFQPGATAVSQIFVIHNNSGSEQINFPELAEDSTEVAISIVCCPENRDALSSLGTLGRQLGVDVASNILKEFSPDLERKISRSTQSTGNGSL
jgi:hypothetical protein